MRTLVRIVAALVALLAFSACHPEAQETLLVGGSATMKEYFEPVIKALKVKKNLPENSTFLESDGSTAGVIAVKRGAIEVAILSRAVSPTEAELDLHEYLVARDGVAIIVNRDNRVDDLTLAQLRQILGGEVHSWMEVGGDEAPIVFIDQQKDDRGQDSRTHKSLVNIVLGGDNHLLHATRSVHGETMEQAVAADRNAVGFISWRDHDSAKAATRAVKINDVPFTHDTLLSGRYPLMRSLYLAVYQDPSLGTPSRLARELVEFTLSEKGLDILEDAGLLRVSARKAR